MNRILFVAGLLLSMSCLADWSGADYSLHSNSQYTDASHVLTLTSMPDVESPSILDVGCGSGEVTLLMAELFPKAHITCVEPNPSMFDKAQKNFKNHERISIHQADAQSFKLNKTFDVFTAFHVMHWLSKEDNATALKNIHRHLSTEATGLLIIAPTKKGLPFEKALTETKQQPAFKEVFEDFTSSQHFFGVDEYRNMLEDAGFFVESIGYIYNEKAYDSTQQLSLWLQQWLPEYKWLQHSHTDLADPFMKQLVLAYKKKTPPAHQTPWGEYIILARVKIIQE